MRTLRRLGIVTVSLIVTWIVVNCPTTASAQGRVTFPPSSNAANDGIGKAVHTHLQMLSEPMTGAPQTAGAPFPGYFYQTPASIACIYGLQPPVAGCNPNVTSLNPRGGHRAVAVVDAFDDPTAFADLTYFSAQFGLAPITPANFAVIYAPPGGTTPGSCTGSATQPPSGAPYGWTIEESLDIEWVHAMAPGAILFLVEGQSNSFSDLYCAVSLASQLVAVSGGGEVSMSWGSGEFSFETEYDPVFTTPNVTYLASAGDGPGVGYPSSSPNVISVGGTTLNTNPDTGHFQVETVWNSTGGGLSSVESRPSYQNDIAGIVGAARGTPDITANANPYTGLWVFDSSTLGFSAWFIVGGTSASVQMWAGILNARGVVYSSSGAALTDFYGHPHGLNDIKSGYCGPYQGIFARGGWDLCSGLGSPGHPMGD